METSHLIFFSKEHLSARTLFTQSFAHTMTDEGKAVKPPLIGDKVIPESLRLHSTIPTQTAAKMANIRSSNRKMLYFEWELSHLTSSMDTKNTWT